MACTSGTRSHFMESVLSKQAAAASRPCLCSYPRSYALAPHRGILAAASPGQKLHKKAAQHTRLHTQHLRSMQQGGVSWEQAGSRSAGQLGTCQGHSAG